MVLTAIIGTVVIIVTLFGIPNTLGNLYDLEIKTKEAIRNGMIGCNG